MIEYDSCLSVLKSMDERRRPEPREVSVYPLIIQVRCMTHTDADRFARDIRLSLRGSTTRIRYTGKASGYSTHWSFIDDRRSSSVSRARRRYRQVSNRHRLEVSYWNDMPEYGNIEERPFITFKVVISDERLHCDFLRRIHQRPDRLVRRYVYPAQQVDDSKYQWVTQGARPIPRYPIYIVSKNRSDTRFTSRTLDAMGVPYRICIEPQDYDAYASVIDEDKICVLPFSNHGLGSGPARNWCRDHAISLGARRHWVLDDNIRGFFRLHLGRKLRVADASIFCHAENFVDRWSNVPLAGFAYTFQTLSSDLLPPFVLNTRCFSCVLLESSSEWTWRGRYNEDLDLSLRILKAGQCTIQFNAFLQNKMSTQTMQGGNTTEFYASEGTWKKSVMIKQLHPDVVDLVWRYGREHHYVAFRKRFRSNQLIPVDGSPESQTLSPMILRRLRRSMRTDRMSFQA